MRLFRAANGGLSGSVGLHFRFFADPPVTYNIQKEGGATIPDLRYNSAKALTHTHTFLPSERWILQLLVFPPPPPYCQVYGARTLYMMRIKQHDIAGGPLLQ